MMSCGLLGMCGFITGPISRLLDYPPEVEDTCVTAYGQNKAKQARQKKKLRFQHETSKYWFSGAVLLFSGIICTPPPA